MCTQLAYADKKEKVNDNWSIVCVSDSVNGEKIHYIETLGKHMDKNGHVFGNKQLIIRVYKSGNHYYIVIPNNDFPGREPVVIIDDNHAMTLSSIDNNTTIVRQLIGAKTAQIDYNQLPYGARHMVVDVRGFDKAFGLLMAK
jgi:hypothetical protein